MGRCGLLLTFLSAGQKYTPGMVYPYKIKIKCFWKYHFLNDPQILESMNTQMFCVSLRLKKNMNLFSSIFYHIKSLNEGWVASLV